MADDEELGYDSLDIFQLYYTYDDIRRTINSNNKNWKTAALSGPALPALGNAVAGAVGAAISNVLTYPLSLVVTRLQTQHHHNRNNQNGDSNQNSSTDGEKKDCGEDEEYARILDAFQKIYTRHGLAGLYSGLAQDTVKTVADSFLFFLVYAFLRGRRVSARAGSRSKKRRNVVLPVWDELGIGILAGAFAKLFTMPIGNVVTRMQISSSSPSSEGHGTDNLGSLPSSTKQIAAQILSEKGFTGFWSGYSASLILTLNPSLTLLLNRLLKYVVLRKLLKRPSKPSAALTFLLAALSKAAASAVMYPFSVAKTRAQAGQIPTTTTTTTTTTNNTNINTTDTEERETDEDEIDTPLFPSLSPQILHTVHTIAKTEGLSALYAGLSAEVLKGFFSHGFTILAKDAIYGSIVRAYYLLLLLFRKYPSPGELMQHARERAEEYEEVVKEGRSDLGLTVAEDDGFIAGNTAGSGHVPVHLHVHVVGGEDDSNATAELVGEYVEDDTEGWRSLYHWFWER